MPEATDLMVCLRRAKEIPSNEKSIQDAAGNPELQSFLGGFFEGFPKCVQSVPALVEQFNCYKTEGEDLQVNFENLKAKGYSKDPELDRICKLSREEMIADSNANLALAQRAARLRGDFGTISTCRIETEKWLDARPVQRGKLWDQVLKRLKKDLEPAQKIETDVKSLAQTLQGELTALKEVFAVGLIICTNNGNRTKG